MIAMDAGTLWNILLIGISGTLICIAVHFIPVGGAPAAMAQATGIGTGTVELAAGSGLVGLITASYMYANEPTVSVTLVMAAGAMGSMVMLASTMLAGGLIYAYAVGTPFASAQVKKDPITRERQDNLVAKGTQGQGLPTVCFVSGVIGSAFGGVGGALIYFVLMGIYSPLITTHAAAVAGVFTMGVFYVNSVIPSYGVGGTIEGFHDPKFKRLPRGALACIIASLVSGIIAVLLLKGGVF